MLAAGATGPSVLAGLSDCDDSRLLRAALETLGVGFADQSGGSVVVTGLGGPPEGQVTTVDVGEAGSTLRFLLPWCAAGQGEFVLTGTPRLFERPHQLLVDFLTAKGALIQSETVSANARPGFRIQAQGLPGGQWRAPVQQSSQYLSGLMMASFWSGGVEIPLPEKLPSRGYFDLTCAAIAAFRGPASAQLLADGRGQLLRMSAGDAQGIPWTVPADPSAATFFLVALVLTGASLRFATAWSELHPEAQLLSLFEQYGLLQQSGMSWQASGVYPQAPVEVDLDRAPDAGPALAVLGAYLPNGMRLHGIHRLRVKESDRVLGIQRLLSLLGQTTMVEGDSLMIPGSGQLGFAEPGGVFDPDQDHRLAMAAGVAAICAERMKVLDPACVNKSFPDFWNQMLKGTARGNFPE
jgi:3-phosphoshikimate 1-carboxyvinyltransferase